MMRSTSCIFLVVVACFLPSVVAGRGKSWKPPSSFVPQFPPRGGAKSSKAPPPPPSSGLDANLDFLLSLGGVVKAMGKSIWNQDSVQDVINSSPAEMIAKVSSFVGKQRQAAVERRKVYQQEDSIRTTGAAVFSAPRALKLTVLAFVMAEILQFLETQTAPVAVTLEKATKSMAIQWDNFVQVGRAEGGLLRPATYTNVTTLTRAVQEQVEPKYQWAFGAAAGFVLSPLCWSLGWTALGCSASVYLVAQVHHLLKARVDKYYYTLKEWNCPFIFAIDDVLEDVRQLIDHAVQEPLQVILAMWDDIDDRIDFYFPPHVQKGLLFGAIVGVIAGA